MRKIVTQILVVATLGCQFVNAQNSDSKKELREPLTQCTKTNAQTAESYAYAKLDSVIETARELHKLPYRLTEKERTQIVKSFIDDAEQSCYFWRFFFEMFHHKDYLFGISSNVYEDAELQVKRALKMVGSQAWGTLLISSEPIGADVILTGRGDRSTEGQTRIRRRYPEGEYRFVVQKNGYESKSLSVQITKEKPVEEIVTLRKLP